MANAHVSSMSDACNSDLFRVIRLPCLWAPLAVFVFCFNLQFHSEYGWLPPVARNCKQFIIACAHSHAACVWALHNRPYRARLFFFPFHFSVLFILISSTNSNYTNSRFPTSHFFCTMSMMMCAKFSCVSLLLTSHDFIHFVSSSVFLAINGTAGWFRVCACEWCDVSAGEANCNVSTVHDFPIERVILTKRTRKMWMENSACYRGSHFGDWVADAEEVRRDLQPIFVCRMPNDTKWFNRYKIMNENECSNRIQHFDIVCQSSQQRHDNMQFIHKLTMIIMSKREWAIAVSITRVLHRKWSTFFTA